MLVGAAGVSRRRVVGASGLAVEGGEAMAENMTAREIIDALCHRWLQSFMLPNYTPRGWWECDVFEMTKSGYFREYEVKVSRADFFADAAKGTTKRQIVGGRSGCDHVMAMNDERWTCRDCGGRSEEVQVENKHNLLGTGSVRGPSRFWYVVPQGLVKLEEVPAWAGLIEARTQRSLHSRSSSVSIRPVKAAPKIHAEKLDDKIATHARSVCYYRMHELRREMRRLRNAQKETVDA